MSTGNVALKGGLDLTESPLEVYPGKMKDGLNFFESIDGGYERVGGYERYDGNLSPSADTYYVVHFDSWATHVTDIVAGSDITAGALSMHVLGTEEDVDNDELLVYACQLTGTIPDDLDVSPINWDGVSSLVSLVQRDGATEALDLAYLEAATDYTRSEIAVVPGDGAPAGVLQISDTVIALSNLSSAPKVYKSTATGWSEVKIGRVAEITGYGDDILPGETIDSAAFRVEAVCEWYDSSGTPDVTKAWLVLIPLTATAAPSTGANTASGGGSFTIASVIQPIAAFGSYIDYQNFNFLSHPDSLCSWIADGTNMPMCYSPTYETLLPVCTNFNDYASEVATKVVISGEQLKFATGQGTFVGSEIGLPFNFSGIYGASETGIGNIITDIANADSEHTIFYSDKAASKLSGTTTATWIFESAASTVGAYSRSVQKLDDIYSFSARGVSSLRRTDVTGGYNGGSVSSHIQELINSVRLKLTCSNAVTAKEQIRWYFNNGSFLMMSRLADDEGGVRHSFGLGLYPDKVIRSISTDIWSDGSERTFFTSDDGYVYEADIGTSFDGDAIYSFCELHSNHFGTPGRDKSFKRVFFEAQSSNEAVLDLSYSLNYGDKTFNTRSLDIFGGRYIYDEGFYDEARFDFASPTRFRSSLKGKGFTAGFTLEHTGKFSLPFKITGYTLDYEPLGRAVK